MSPAICFNLDQSKIPSSGNGLNQFLIEFGPVHKTVVWQMIKKINSVSKPARSKSRRSKIQTCEIRSVSNAESKF